MNAVKSAPAECTFRLVETGTRDAIKSGNRTIAYVAIGAELHGPLLAAAPDLLAALKEAEKELRFLNVNEAGGQLTCTPAMSVIQKIRAAISKAEGATL